MEQNHSTPQRPSSAVSAEALFRKYSLPPGTNEDAIARVLARLGDLPLSSARAAGGGSPARADTSDSRGGGNNARDNNTSAKGTPPGSSRKAPSSSSSGARARGGGGGIPAPRVAWSDGNDGGNGNNPLAMLQDYDEDDEGSGDDDGGVDKTISGGAEDLHPGERAVRLLASAKASRLKSAEKTTQQKSGGGVNDSGGNGNASNGGGGGGGNASNASVLVSPKQRAGVMGKLKDETAAANARARRLETALQRRDQEVEELKAKVAAMARERSALATLKARTIASSGAVTNAAAAAAKRLPGSPKSGAPKTPRKPSGETLSLSSRWHQWELEARKGDRRIALLLKSYKQMEGEYEVTYKKLEVGLYKLNPVDT
jgi:hypothetical protein